ncbi:MAG: LexA family protein [Oceanococcus sp.]
MYKALRQQNLVRLIQQQADGHQAEFASMIGKSPSYVGQLVRGVGSFGDRVARQIEQHCRLPKGWLDQQEQASSSVVARELEAPRSQGLCPMLSWVAAGSWHGMETPSGSGDDAEEWLPCPVRHSSDTFALLVRGESMYNPLGRISFNDGDLIFVDPQRHPENKACVVVRREQDQSATFKQLIQEGEPPQAKRYLKPLNPNWPEPIMEFQENDTLCGVVIFKGMAL